MGVPRGRTASGPQRMECMIMHKNDEISRGTTRTEIPVCTEQKRK